MLSFSNLSSFQNLGTENFVYEEVYENLFKIANEITAIKDIFAITKLGFLIDSSISQRHDVLNFNECSKKLDCFAIETILFCKLF